jgi:hypothetical protein
MMMMMMMMMTVMVIDDGSDGNYRSYFRKHIAFSIRENFFKAQLEYDKKRNR